MDLRWPWEWEGTGLLNVDEASGYVVARWMGIRILSMSPTASLLGIRAPGRS